MRSRGLRLSVSLSLLITAVAVGAGNANAILQMCENPCMCEASNRCSCPVYDPILERIVWEDMGDCTPQGGDRGSQRLPKIDIRADVNRDGQVTFVPLSNDPDEAGESNWSAERGAIVLPNLDDDGMDARGGGEGNRYSDADDEVVNGDRDREDMAFVRVLPWIVADRSSLDGYASVVPSSDRVRLFIQRRNGTYTYWNPQSDFLSLADLEDGQTFLAEATDVARRFQDRFVDITVTLEIVDANSTVIDQSSDTVRLRIAPVMFHHHLQPAQTVFISPNLTSPDTDGPTLASFKQFERDMTSHALSAGITVTRYEGDTFDETFGIGAWMQDKFEKGYLSAPKVGGGVQTMDVFMINDARRELNEKFGRIASGPGVAVIHVGDSMSSNFDMGGNFEVAPPTRNAPYGRIVRGSVSKGDTVVQQFVRAQEFQRELTQDVDTSWLNVGHIDELFSFVPAPNARGWVVLYADPRLARDLILNLIARGNHNAKILPGIAVDSILQETTLLDLFGSLLWRENEAAIQLAERSLAQLTSQLALTSRDVVRLPVFFYNETVDLNRPAMSAFTADVVNGALLSPTVFAAPRPYGPRVNGKDVFETYVENALRRSTRVQVRWVEDFLSYHALKGEVHCGSNVLREIPEQQWWQTAAGRSPYSNLRGSEKAKKGKKAKRTKKGKKVKRSKKSARR